MVDIAVGSVTKIIEVALMIMDAVDTVKHNKEVCIDIKTRVTRLSAILQKLDEADAMKDPAMSATLLGLEETLHRAHSTVKACQKKRRFSHVLTAHDLSKELFQVKQDISTHAMDVILATTVQMTMMITTRFQDGVTGANPKKLSTVLSKVQSMQGGQEVSLVDSHPVCRRTNVEGDVKCSPFVGAFGSPERTKCKIGRRGRSKAKMAPRQPEGVAYRGADPRRRATTPSGRGKSPAALCAGPRRLVSPPSPGRSEEHGFTIFTLTELKDATNNFSEEHLTGRGGFAEVYKGVLPDGRVVAIKKFYQIASSEEEQHVAHYVTLFSVLRQHENVVRFLGYCQEVRFESVAYEGNKFVPAQDGVMMVVEEYITNGTLSELIRGQSLQQVDWYKRFQIILGVAQGAAYLHSENIIHLNLKPENVLLDSDMTPKICDFELSRILDEGVTEELTKDISGTVHYMAPEYIINGVISVKNDVYSFGILLLETINGMSTSSRHSFDWVRNALEGQDVDGLLDPSWCDESQLQEVKRCLHIGLLCAATERNDRPTMAEVVEMLDGKEQLPTLKRNKASFKKKDSA